LYSEETSNKDVACTKLIYSSLLSSKEFLLGDENRTSNIEIDSANYSLKSSLDQQAFGTVEIVPNEFPQLALIQDINSIKVEINQEEKNIIDIINLNQKHENRKCLLFGSYDREQIETRKYKVNLFLLSE
jgi:hypothetical protein